MPADPETIGHIKAITGITPDERLNIPDPETIANIRGAQQGDEAAKLELLAGKLVWLYRQFATKAEFQAAGYDEQEIMQAGATHVLDVASSFKSFENKQAAAIFRSTVAAKMKITLRAPDEPKEPDVIDDLLLSDRTLEKPSIEAEVISHRKVAAGGIIEAMAELRPREKTFLLLQAEGLSHEDIALILGVSRSRAGQIAKQVHAKVLNYELRMNLQSGMSAALAVDDVTNYGLISQNMPRFSRSSFEPVDNHYENLLLINKLFPPQKPSDLGLYMDQ